MHNLTHTPSPPPPPTPNRAEARIFASFLITFQLFFLLNVNRCCFFIGFKMKQNKQFGFIHLSCRVKRVMLSHLFHFSLRNVCAMTFAIRQIQMLIEKLHRVHRIVNAFQMKTVEKCLDRTLMDVVLN